MKVQLSRESTARVAKPSLCLDVFGSSAIISECGYYRYRLERIWDNSKPTVMFVMLNPSTADATKDDRTIARCIGFARRWGFGGLLVGNLFAFRATKPGDLLRSANPVGIENEKYLDEMYGEASMCVVAWGNSATVNKIVKTVQNYKPLKGWKAGFYYLELCQDGTPKHPLFIRSDIEPKQFDMSKQEGVLNLTI